MGSMKTIITGSSGFIGSHLVRTLNNPYIIDLRNGDNLLDDALDIELEADVVIHLAAMPLVPESIENPWYSFRHNVAGTIKVLEYCRRTHAKLIFTSSAQATLDAKNPYALQKYQCEQWIQMYRDLYSIEAVTLKLHNVFGDGGHTVIESFLARKAHHEPLIINGGQQKRDFIHVDAVVKVLNEAKDWDSGTYEIGSGVSLSVQEVADMISEDQVHELLPKGEPTELCANVATESLSVKEYLLC